MPVVWSSGVPDGYYEIDAAQPEAFFTFSTEVNATYAVLLQAQQSTACEQLPAIAPLYRWLCDLHSQMTTETTEIAGFPALES